MPIDFMKLPEHLTLEDEVDADVLGCDGIALPHWRARGVIEGDTTGTGEKLPQANFAVECSLLGRAVSLPRHRFSYSGDVIVAIQRILPFGDL